MRGRPPRSTRVRSSAASDVYKRQDMNKCVHCLRCIRTCAELQGVGALGVIGRGDSTTMSPYLTLPISEVVCINCGQCINRCQTGALQEVDNTDDVWAAIEDPTKHVVIQTAPAPRAAIGEEFGQQPGTPMTWHLNTALCLLYTSPSPRDRTRSRMPSSA